MTIIIFCLTLLVLYGIICIAYKAWKRADINEKMEDIEETEESYEKVVKFKKAHNGNTKKR